jgi:acyl carrier protein
MEELKMDKIEEFKLIVAQYSKVSAGDMTEDMTFREDLGLTSLDFMTFLGELEDTFDIELDLDSAVHISTLGEAFEMLEELVEA